MVVGLSFGFSLSLAAGLSLSAGLSGGGTGSAKASPATTAVSTPAAAHPYSLRMAFLSSAGQQPVIPDRPPRPFASAIPDGGPQKVYRATGREGKNSRWLHRRAVRGSLKP